MSDRYKQRYNCIALLIIAGIILGVYLKLLSSEVMLVNQDGVLVYASSSFWAESIKQGELPLWNPYTSIGMPFLADVQMTTFNPLNLLFLIFNAVLALNLSRLIQLTVAGYFMYLLMNGLSKNYYVAVVTGLVYAFSTMLGGLRIEHHTIITTLAMIPLILYFVEKYRESDKDKWLIGSSIFMAVQFTSGFTQICLYFDILLFFWILYILRTKRFSIKKSVLVLIKWGGIYLLLISIQLIPLINLMLQSGRNEVSWDFFALYAYDLRILLMIFLPFAYTSLYEPFNGYNSSGIDIEIYIGIICVIYVLYVIIYHFKNKYIRFITVSMTALFVYGMSPNVPFLGKIIYQIPLLNSFRCCARTLPIAVTLAIILFGFGLSNLKDYSERKKIAKINIILIVVLLTNLLIIKCVFSQSIFDENMQYTESLIQCIIVALIMCILNLIIIKFIDFEKRKWLSICSIFLIGIIIIIDVARFSVPEEDRYLDASENLSMGVASQIESLVTTATENNYRVFGAIDSMQDYGNDNMKLAKGERAKYLSKFVYNNYITFMDKKVNYWGLAETVLFPTMTTYLNTRNDLVSMLGIKYILDDDKHEIQKISKNKMSKEKIKEWKNMVIPDRKDVWVFQEEADWLKEDTIYEVTLNCDSETMPEIFYADFYNIDYDYPEQDGVFIKQNDSNVYQTQIHVGDLPSELVYFRIVSGAGKEVELSDISIHEVQFDEQTNYVELEESDAQITVYENLNAKPIVYVPERIYSIQSYGDSYIDSGMEDVDKNNYIVNFGEDLDLTDANTEISDIKVNKNSVSATVASEKTSFVNLSVLSYPGWKAYVDGKEVMCYTVNNLIQGIRVPKGNHLIEFEYDPLDVKIGVAVSSIGIFVVVLSLWCEKRRKKVS